MIIGERLKGLLKHLRITAKEFAGNVGVTEGMVYKYYKMDNVDFTTLSKWAEVLYVPIVTFTDDYQYRLKTEQLTEDEKEQNRTEAQKNYDEKNDYAEFKKNRNLFLDKEKKYSDAIVEKDKALNQLIENNTTLIETNQKLVNRILELTDSSKQNIAGTA